ncbi:molybdopterin dinucleotide binding domain-containing protein, partial [Morganella morganii]
FPTASGRAQLVAEPYRAAQEKRDARYPLTLNTGRLRDQWHGMSRTGTCARLFGHEEEALVHLHPEELRRSQLRDRQLVRLKSRRGARVLPVSADDSVRPGQAFLPMHWGDRFL